jgi:formate-dependent nitrite reductase cytochrome c552 subunit
MDSRFENTVNMTKWMESYQNELKETGLEGMGIRPMPNERVDQQGKYLGSQSCVDCHDTAANAWRKSNHSKAWQSLSVTAKPARTFDPECIACHVVGWNPQTILPYKDGYASEEKTPLLTSVGCESCHGPGEQHFLAEKGSDKAKQENLRKAIRLPVAEGAAKKHCITCHDGDNSPKFDFDVYWKKIEHKNEVP